MKKIFITILVAFVFTFTSNAASSISFDPANANTIFIPVNKDIRLSLKELSVISVKEYETISGRKMNLLTKINFKTNQRKLRKNMNADGTMTNKEFQNTMKIGDPSTGFHIGGFALGLFLGPIGILTTYIIKSDEDVDRNRRKNAWAGFGILVGVFALLLSSY